MGPSWLVVWTSARVHGHEAAGVEDGRQVIERVLDDPDARGPVQVAGEWPLKPSRKVPVRSALRVTTLWMDPRVVRVPSRAGVADGQGAVQDLGCAGVSIERRVEENSSWPDLGDADGVGLGDCARHGQGAARGAEGHAPIREARRGEAGQGVEGDRSQPGIVATDVEQCTRAEDAGARKLQRHVHLDRRAAGGELQLHLRAGQDADVGGRAERVRVLQANDTLIDTGLAGEGAVGAAQDEQCRSIPWSGSRSR